MKKNESAEISIGSASGIAGVGSIPFGKGYFQSGNNGAMGIQFTPSEEPRLKSYKNMKHSKKNLKKMKKIKKFEDFINEDACATMGNTGGMGAVVSAQPSATPGDTNGSIPGSGDIGQGLGTAYTKPQLQLKKKKKKVKKIQTFEKYFGGNSGYVGYSMSKRAKDARNDGKYPKTDFKKEYHITDNSLNSLIDAGYINNNEWHHTSKYGNKTIFYSWDEDYYFDIYISNKKEIDKISSDKKLNQKETVDKIKYIFENSDIYKNKEIEEEKLYNRKKHEMSIWTNYNNNILELNKQIKNIDREINMQFNDNLPQNKLSKSPSGALFYNHSENDESSGILIEPNRLNNLSWRNKYLQLSDNIDNDIKIKTRLEYIKDADIAFNKIDKNLFIEKQKLEKQKEEERLLYNKNLEIFRKNENIDNFTARYYDNYDDEEDENHYEENSIDALKKIQMYENK